MAWYTTLGSSGTQLDYAYTMQIFLVSCKLMINHYYHRVEKGNQGVNNSDFAQTYVYS